MNRYCCFSQVGQIAGSHDSLHHPNGAPDRVHAFRPLNGLGRVFPPPLGPHHLLFRSYSRVVHYGCYSDTGGPERAVAIQQTGISRKIFSCLFCFLFIITCLFTFTFGYYLIYLL